MHDITITNLVSQGELDELEREEFFRLKKVQAKKKRDAADKDSAVIEVIQPVLLLPRCCSSIAPYFLLNFVKAKASACTQNMLACSLSCCVSHPTSCVRVCLARLQQDPK